MINKTVLAVLIILGVSLAALFVVHNMTGFAVSDIDSKITASWGYGSTGTYSNCKDPDGWDIYTKSKVKLNTFSGGVQYRTDYCSGNLLNEYSCSSWHSGYKKSVSQWYNCTYGCSDGACLKPQNQTTSTSAITSVPSAPVYYAINTNSNTPAYCRTNHLAVGARSNPSGSGLWYDYLYCDSKNIEVDSANKRLIISPDTGNAEYLCNSDEVVCGYKNDASHTSAIGGIYCCKLKQGVIQPNTKRSLSPAAANSDSFCNSDEVVCGSKNNYASCGINCYANMLYCCKFCSTADCSAPATPAPATAAQPAACIDTDGRNFYSKGNVTGYNNADQKLITTAIDRCVNSTRVYDSFCEGDYVNGNYENCPYGCEDGACRQASTKCTDTDGFNMGVKGTTTDSFTSKIDNCFEDGKTLAEYYCTKSLFAEQLNFVCPNGCTNGACTIA